MVRNTGPRILVCGGRGYDDDAQLNSVLTELCNDRGWSECKDGPIINVVVISGKARGADTLAAKWALSNWADLEEYPANWAKYGKSAGPIRNKQMLDEGRPDIVVAFPGGRGTAHMVSLAKEAGVEVLEVI